MALTPASFDYVRTALRQRAGHCLDEDKAYLVETRLLPVARSHGFTSVEDLVRHMQARRSERLLGEVVEAMTINETFFFRDGHPFEMLRTAVLPELVRLRARSRTLTIWSAACSSGQEPYSVVMLLLEHFPELSGWNVRVIASDLSSAMLARARQGRYSPLEVSRGLPSPCLERYFERRQDGWQIRDNVRRLVEFRVINLCGLWPELPPLDLVLLRNVLIYFDDPTKRQILNRVRKALQPDGFLLLGGAETTYSIDEAFQPVSFEQGSYYRLRIHCPDA